MTLESITPHRQLFKIGGGFFILAITFMLGYYTADMRGRARFAEARADIRIARNTAEYSKESIEQLLYGVDETESDIRRAIETGDGGESERRKVETVLDRIKDSNRSGIEIIDEYKETSGSSENAINRSIELAREGGGIIAKYVK